MTRRLLERSDALSTIAILAAILSPMRLPPVWPRYIPELSADLYVPEGHPAPGVVLVLGALREGRQYPLLVHAAQTVAACGFAVLVPELGRLRRLVLGHDAVDDLVRAAVALPRLPGVIDGQVGLFGFSLGGSLALLAAGDPRLHECVSCVASMGGYYSLTDMISAATTGSLAAPAVYAVAASLVAMLPSPNREALESVLDEHRDAPLAALSARDIGTMDPQSQKVLALLSNRDPGKVRSLVDEIDGLKGMLERLSPSSVIDRIEAPIWALHDMNDRYVPIDQLRQMRDGIARRPNLTCFEIRVLEHTEPIPPAINPVRLFGEYVPGLWRLGRFIHGPLGAVRAGARRDG